MSDSAEIDESWLEPGGIVPVDPETTGMLVKEIQRLRGVLSGDATFLRAVADEGALDIGLKHPIVNAMAAALAEMVGDANYVEMRMKHRQTGEEYTVHVQRISKPTPHELRRQAEKERDEALKVLQMLRAAKE